MNRFMEEQWSMFEGTQQMRIELMESLTDADLAFSPGGKALTLGELCREVGEIDHAYIQSFKTRKQDWNYKNTEPGLERSVAKLTDWYKSLDGELKAVLSALSDEEFKQTIDRDGYPMPMEYQMQAYLQSLLIFFGKATVYLKAMNKPLTQKLQDWIW